MNFFNLLRQHVVTDPGAIAWQSTRRTFTYRRFWSRIERATARLKGEWHVKPGDTVAYFGCGHPDALILYFAVARCGAKLLPLEHASLQQNAAAILQQIPTVLLLHDDEIVLDDRLPVTLTAKLSTLIATRCHYYLAIDEDDTQPSLISIVLQDGTIAHSQQSLQAACAQIGAVDGREYRVTDTLFDQHILTPRVLSTLAARGTIFFR
jgi:acyl-coenzyme A synthetase/AMP-(fatty) acid ligase